MNNQMNATTSVTLVYAGELENTFTAFIQSTLPFKDCFNAFQRSLVLTKAAFINSCILK